MLGGLWGRYRELITDGDYGAFETDINELLGDRIRADAQCGVDMWGALANVDWKHEAKKIEIGYSFRAAGDLIAAIRQEGDYLRWYCSGNYPVIPEWIAVAMATRGWSFSHDGNVSTGLGADD